MIINTVDLFTRICQGKSLSGFAPTADFVLKKPPAGLGEQRIANGEEPVGGRPWPNESPLVVATDCAVYFVVLVCLQLPAAGIFIVTRRAKASIMQMSC